MRTRDLIYLIALGMLWGLSFVLIRVAAPEFGAFALMEARVAMAALLLLPVVVARREAVVIRRHWRAIVLLGLLHYAVPFCLLAFALLTLTGGYSAIINASAPLFAGTVAWAWAGERPVPERIAGLATGLCGVVVLVGERLGIGAEPAAPAVAAAVLAAFCYGFSAVLAKQKLSGVSPLAVTAGSMACAAAVLLPVAVLCWPDTPPSGNAWGCAALLGIACTAVAFGLYFRLVDTVGPGKAITVTFLIPVFAVLFGALFVDESLSPRMLGGGAVILLGTGLSTGVLRWSAKSQQNVSAWSRRASGKPAA